VIVNPSQPGNHGMPTPPKPVGPGQRIDPSRNGDGRAVQPPSDRNGQALPQKPLQNAQGRMLPPGQGDIGRIDRPDIRQDIHGVQDSWNTNDHGYDWHDWDGMSVCHHYDEFGYHWWGFYVGSSYYWTRYYNDNYWWFDPYWHRWLFLNDGQWWWQSPDGGLYLYDGSNYYQYNSGDNGVVVTPDQTPPVDVPPGNPTPASAPATYSLDGTRSILITGAGKDAYLYDMTVTDSNDPAAQGRYLASGVQSAAFVNQGGAIREIILTAVDASGNQTTLTFDRDGASTGSSAAPADQPTAPVAQPSSDGASIETFKQKTQGSATLNALKTGISW
jgi:hypothetical protein